MMNNLRIYVLSFAFLLSCLGMVMGQERDVVDLGSIVITASRIAQHGYKVSSDVTIIDTTDIEVLNAQTVSDILKQQPGISVYDTGTIQTAVVDIRGFGDTAARNVLVLVNDRKVNSIDMTGPDFLQIPLEIVKRIEIIRGAGSVLYGDNAVGGVVNIITKEGEGDLSGQVQALYGSFRTEGVNTQLFGSKPFDFLGLDHNLSYMISSKYYDTGGHRDNGDILTKDFNGQFGYKLSDKISLDLHTGWHESDYGLPGGLSASELQTFGRKGTAEPNNFANATDRFIQMVIDVRPWPEDIDWGHFVVDFSYRNRDTYGSFADFNFNTKREIDSFGLTSKYVFNQTIFDKEFNFVTGIDYYDTTNQIIGSGTNSDNLTISKEERGFYLFSEYEFWDDIHANAGTRFHEADYTFDQRAGFIPGTITYDTASPAESVNTFGMKYEYARGSNAFFDVEQTFRYLATDEWYDSFTGTLNTDLKQQTGLQYEAGLKHNWQDKVLINGTFYWMDLNNEIYYDPKGGPWGSGANDNYGKTRRTGFEVSQTTNLLKMLDLEILDRLEFFTNYTYQNPEFVDGDNNGKQIPMTSKHQANWGLSLNFIKRFGITLSGRYTGFRYPLNDTENITAGIKPYCVMDSKFSFEAKHLEFFLELNNIFDGKYYSYAAKKSGSLDKDHYPAPERNFLIGVTGKF